MGFRFNDGTGEIEHNGSIIASGDFSAPSPAGSLIYWGVNAMPPGSSFNFLVPYGDVNNAGTPAYFGLSSLPIGAFAGSIVMPGFGLVKRMTAFQAVAGSGAGLVSYDLVHFPGNSGAGFVVPGSTVTLLNGTPAAVATGVSGFFAFPFAPGDGFQVGCNQLPVASMPSFISVSVYAEFSSP